MDGFIKMNIIGREREQERLHSVLHSRKAEFLALYGRRRVGKTFLVREYFKDKASVFFFVTGKKAASKKEQLRTFQNEIEKQFLSGSKLAPFSTWAAAFEQLKVALVNHFKNNPKGRVVLFLDELPWLAGKRSDLLSQLDYSWNTELQYMSQLILVICGSAASWIIKNVINSKGGLHNRVTCSINLQPFSLREVNIFLKKAGFNWDYHQTLEMYLALGGIAYYLNLLDPRKSAQQNIANLCFEKGELANELDNLFEALFGKTDGYLAILKLLAQAYKGLTRTEILKRLKWPSGGQYSEMLKELETASFIDSVEPYGRKERDSIYYLTDPFTLFALNWMRGKGLKPKIESSQEWLLASQSVRFRSWAGYAFERVCFKHVVDIKKALGFSAVSCWYGPISLNKEFDSGNEKSGAQIDLLFDRADKVTTLLEIKYHQAEFELTKQFAESMEKKRSAFISHTGTKNFVNLVLLTNRPVKENDISRRLNLTLIDSKELF